MSAPDLMLLALVIPLIGAVTIVLFGKIPNLREAATLVTAVSLFAVALNLLPVVADGGRPDLNLIEVLPGLELRFTLEPLGMLFALIASGLWIVNSIYSIGYMRAKKESNQTRFYVCFALAIFGAMGVALAGNMFTLFICYEVLTITTYPLVTHAGTPEAMRSGRTYLGLLLGSSIGLQLAAIIGTWYLTGTLDFRDGGVFAGHVQGPVIGLLLFLYVYGIGKAALMPIHRWLPAAMVAPTPVSALLHAVAVVKAGVFTVLKVIVYLFGSDFLRESGYGDWLAYIAGATVLTASLIAMTKDNLKARLAYSTVSQLSYIILGAALFTPLGAIGGAMHIAMHALGKITLFFCAGAIYVASGKTQISDMHGIGRVMPFTLFAFFIGSLSVIGLPPMGGSWSKYFIAMGALESGQIVFVAVLMISSLLNIAYLLPIVARGFFSPPSDEIGSGNVAATKIKEAPLLCVAPLCLTAFGCIVLFFYADPLYRLLAPIGGG
ncbi:MAG: monovalent cation/H+ antiporter subunit D family protein [Alphaproteobacteria bacterium]|nr:monovalent cation/H+ antiporter subunit D family protein [Alphaproteobacteria bacterium]